MPATRTPVDVTGFTHGGEGVARLPDGKTCFVPGTIPGERVVVEVVEERRRWARGRLVEVLEASADRVTPPCPYAGVEQPDGPPRCGGCGLQHIAPARQAELKRRVVVEQLQRIGRFPDPLVHPTRTVAALGYRTHARFGVAGDGRLGFRRPRSNEILPIDVCLLLTEDTQRLREEAGDAWAGTTEVSVRRGDDAGVLVVRPGAEGVPPLPPGDTPVALLGASQAVALRGEATTVVTVDGLRLQVSPTSFFQPGPAGAALLVELVRDAAGLDAGATAVDLYAGVGLFAAALASDGARVTAVEAHAAAAADATANLAPWPDATVLRGDATEAVTGMLAEGMRVDVVVLDPPRRGAGTELCTLLPRLADRVVYVSCDPAAFARDARALSDAGLMLTDATPVDQFAQTAAIEIVGRFG